MSISKTRKLSTQTAQTKWPPTRGWRFPPRKKMRIQHMVVVTTLQRHLLEGCHPKGLSVMQLMHRYQTLREIPVVISRCQASELSLYSEGISWAVPQGGWMWRTTGCGTTSWKVVRNYNYMSSYRLIHSLTRYQHSNSPYHKLLYMNLFPRSLLWVPGLRYKRSGNQIWLASWTFSMVSVEKMPSCFIFAAFAHHFVCCRRCRQDRRSRALFSPLSYFVIYFSKRSCGRRFSGSHSVDRSRKISQKLHNRGGLGGGGRRSPCHVFPLSGLRYSLNYIFERRPIPFDKKNCITHEV